MNAWILFELKWISRTRQHLALLRQCWMHIKFKRFSDSNLQERFQEMLHVWCNCLEANRTLLSHPNPKVFQYPNPNMFAGPKSDRVYKSSASGTADALDLMNFSRYTEVEICAVSFSNGSYILCFCTKRSHSWGCILRLSWVETIDLDVSQGPLWCWCCASSSWTAR